MPVDVRRHSPLILFRLGAKREGSSWPLLSTVQKKKKKNQNADLLHLGTSDSGFFFLFLLKMLLLSLKKYFFNTNNYIWYIDLYKVLVEKTFFFGLQRNNKFWAV